MIKKMLVLICVFMITLHLVLEKETLANDQGNNESGIELSQQPIEREIAGSQSHCYYINLIENQFLYLDVAQQGIDIKISLQGEGVNFETNTPELLYEPEPLYWIAKKTGRYTIIVKPAQENVKTGKYTIKSEIRTAVSQDIYYTRAQERFTEAEKLRSKNNFLAAIDCYKQAIEEWKKVQQKERQAVCLNMIGETSFNLEDLESAKIFFEKSLEMFPVGSGLAQAFNSLGHVYFAMNEPEKAIKFFSDGLRVNEQINDKNVEMNALNGLGNIYRNLNKKDQAFSTYNQVIKLSHEAGNLLEEGTALYNIAIILRGLGEHEKALIFLNKALIVFEKGNSPLGHRVATLNEIATDLVFLRNFDLAAKTYDTVIGLATKNGLNTLKIPALISKGYNQYIQREYEKSLMTYQEALDLNAVVKSQAFESVILRQIGLNRFLLGDNEKALINYEKAYELSKAINNEHSIRWVLYRKAELYQKLGQLELAINSIEKAIELTEIIRERSLNTELKTFELVEGNNFYDFYINLLMILNEKQPGKGYDAKALYFYELSKARGLLDLVSESGIDIRKSIDKALINRELQIQDSINKKNSILRNITLEEEKVKLIEEINVLNLDLQQLQVAIKESSSSYSQIKRTIPLTLEEIQKNILDDDTLLIEYSLGKLNSYVWVVTNKMLNTYKLPSSVEIEKLSWPVATYFKTQFKLENESLENRRERIAEQEFFRKSLTSFSETILGQINKHLTKKKIIFVANRTLQGMPFAALLKPNTKNNQDWQPLVIDHEIINLPSISILGALREKTIKEPLPSKSIMIAADPVLTSNDNRLGFNSKKNIETSKINYMDEKIEPVLAKRLFERGNFGQLPFVGLEAQAIANVYSKDSPKLLLGLSANLLNVTNPEISEYSILHFATHGFIDKLSPELSGIVLSLYDANGNDQDGYLTANNIFNLKLKANLVVLSACETGLGKELKAEGILGLTRGFFYAGAKRVLFSLWNINDESTSVLMKRFYTAMKKEKLTPAAALRQAQISMYKNKKWSAPYYWAAFQLQGDF